MSTFGGKTIRIENGAPRVPPPALPIVYVEGGAVLLNGEPVVEGELIVRVGDWERPTTIPVRSGTFECGEDCLLIGPAGSDYAGEPVAFLLNGELQADLTYAFPLLGMPCFVSEPLTLRFGDGPAPPVAAPCLESVIPTPTPTLIPTHTATPAPTPIPGFNAEEYFGNRRIVVNVGYTPGGGYDTYARLVAHHLPKHLPGDQSYVVRNITGAGGARIFRETLIEAEPEGYAVAVMHPRFIKRELVGDDVPDFDLDTVKIVGTASAVSLTSAMYAFKDYALTWDDAAAKDREPRYGATAPGDAGGIAAAFLELVGAPIRVIYNYDGTSEIAAAFDKGELDISDRGGPDTARSLFPSWIERRQITPLFHWGADPADDQEFSSYVRNDLAAQIPPHLFDVISLTDDQKALFDLTESINDRMNHLFVMHPDTPEHIYQIWVEAFRKTVADPEFIEATSLIGREVGYAGPDDLLVVLENGKRTLQDPVLREAFITMAGVEQ